MRVIVAGSRTIKRYEAVVRAIANSHFEITEVVSGTCRGVDQLGERWAEENGVAIARFPADWSLGKKAGPLRNEQMAVYADAAIILWDGVSRGTRSMIKLAKKHGLTVFIDF